MNDMATRVCLTLMILFFGTLTGLAGLGFLLAALYLGLAAWLTPAWAAAATGLIILGVVTLALLLARLRAAGRATRQRTGTPSGAAVGALAAERLRGAMEDHRLLVTGGAFSLGFYLGVNPEARRAVGRAALQAQREAARAAASVPDER